MSKEKIPLSKDEIKTKVLMTVMGGVLIAIGVATVSSFPPFAPLALIGGGMAYSGIK